LNKGVAGFRLDAVPTLFEDEQLRDEKVLPGTNAYGDPDLDDSMTTICLKCTRSCVNCAR
jgi:alpha-glucosidase